MIPGAPKDSSAFGLIILSSLIYYIYQFCLYPFFLTILTIFSPILDCYPLNIYYPNKKKS